MKKFTAILLCIVMLMACMVPAFAESDTESKIGFGSYKHVYIVGFDGAGGAWGDCDTPNFDRIFKNGAVRYNCQSEIPTISAQNWGSILGGVACDVHGLTNDNTADNFRYSDSDNGTIFRYVREAMPDAKMASIVNWHNVNKGIVENDIGVKKIWRASDYCVADAVCGLFSMGYKPTLMFVHFNDCDEAGHDYGGEAEEYYTAVEEADEKLGVLYDGIVAAGGMEDALFILTCDHGECAEGGHGGTSAAEQAVTVAITGKNVNNITLPEGTRNRDVAAIALYALGIEEPSHMTAVVPEGLFGETEHEVCTEKAELTAEQIPTKLLYVLCRFANLFCAPWDFIVV